MNLRTDKHGMKQKKYRMLCRAAITLLLFFLLFIALFLVYEGVRYSYFLPITYEQQSIYELQDSTLKHFLLFMGICFLTSVVLTVWQLLQRYKVYGKFLWDEEKLCRIMLFWACIWLTVVGYLYLREHPYYPIGDQISTTAGAAYARAGDFSMFANGGYIGLFEYQKGFLFLYEILFTLFGDFCYGVAAKFHLGFVIVTVIAGYSFLKIVAEKPLYRILYCLMMVFCVPYIAYLPFIYGDLPSICFSTVLFWALAAYAKYSQKRYLVTGSIAASLALFVRLNTWIVLIAVGIGMILVAMEKGSLRPILAGLCILLVARGSVKAVDLMYEYRSGFESGVQIPLILSIAMGMQETNGNPGVYNRYHQSVYAECGFEREPAIQVGKEYISGRLKQFRENPAYAKYFFLKKLKIQWVEPLFDGLYETESFKKDIEYIPNWISSLYYGRLHDIVWKFANYYQSMIYLSMLVFVIGSLWKQRDCFTNCVGYIPLIAITGGFLFSIIWESKSRYALPYFMYMIMYASIGIGKIAEAVSALGNKFLGKTVENRISDSDDLAA